MANSPQLKLQEKQHFQVLETDYIEFKKHYSKNKRHTARANNEQTKADR